MQNFKPKTLVVDDDLWNVVSLLCQVRQPKYNYLNIKNLKNKNQKTNEDNNLNCKRKRETRFFISGQYQNQIQQQQDPKQGQRQQETQIQDKLMTLLNVVENEKLYSKWEKGEDPIPNESDHVVVDQINDSKKCGKLTHEQLVENQNNLLCQMKEKLFPQFLPQYNTLLELFKEERAAIEKSRKEWATKIPKNMIQQQKLFHGTTKTHRNARFPVIKGEPYSLIQIINDNFNELQQSLVDKITLELKKVHPLLTNKQNSQKIKIHNVKIIKKNNQTNQNNVNCKKQVRSIKRERLSVKSKTVLKKWIEKRIYTVNGPYASYQEKMRLSKSAKISYKQVSSYLGNYRRKIKERIKKGEIETPIWY
ncbi:tgfb-induced factor homeobox 2-like x-linked [Anaeramoeba flamelloides]|uniref:Tgfb-induced factor homeobox 2-like x-linked n=1 Tax=Anaeramoeba flamelloides TaxID=1746091 RepID=A0AAV7ZEZ2_9EUKA|nr:tgfb-induced factor homeobox 2-like x-linked [Anaeramoeba flamelloides]